MKFSKSTVLSALFAATVVAAAGSAQAGMVYDLRLADGSHSAVVTSTGTYTLQLWGRIEGANATYTDDLWKSGYLAIESTKTGAALFTGTGNGITSSARGPALKQTTPLGVSQDFNADGVLDLGNSIAAATNQANLTHYFQYGPVATNYPGGTVAPGSQAVAGNANAWEVMLGSFTVTVNGFSATATAADKVTFTAIVPNRVKTSATVYANSTAYTQDNVNFTTGSTTSFAQIGGSVVGFEFTGADVPDPDPVPTLSLVAGIAGVTSDDLHVTTTVTGGVTSPKKTDIANPAAGSIEIVVDGASAAVGPTYVMLWLTGTDLAMIDGIDNTDSEYAKLMAAYDNPTKILKYGNGLGALGNGSTFTYDFDGADIQLVGIAAVPEPASLGLLAIGAMGLLARRRK